ncbi:MAG: hypothetical protein WDA75_03775 [Candidatus Latescibacterota bacterium]|jgi:hypothetical protein
MTRRKRVSTARLLGALGLVSAYLTGAAFAQGMGPGGAMAGGGAMMGNLGGMSWPDSLQTVTVSGAVLVESGQVHDLYALDTNGDGAAEYRLSFGPWWYEPASGAVRPGNGEPVTVKGGVYPVSGASSLLLVFEINGLPWREPGELLPWSGGWMHGATDTTYFRAPTDSLSWMGFPSAVMGDLMRRMMGTMEGLLPDSAYVHFEALGPDRLPGTADAAIVGGCHVGLADPWGNDLMGDAMAMDLSQPIEMHLHYDGARVASTPGPAGSALVLKALSADGVWVEVADATVDPVAEVVSLNSGRVSAYYALFAVAPSPTAVEASSWGAIKTGMPR